MPPIAYNKTNSMYVYMKHLTKGILKANDVFTLFITGTDTDESQVNFLTYSLACSWRPRHQHRRDPERLRLHERISSPTKRDQQDARFQESLAEPGLPTSNAGNSRYRWTTTNICIYIYIL